MPEQFQWVCEACDSPNSVPAGEPAVCPYCRLTCEVKIPHDPAASGAASSAASETASSAAIEAAAELLGGEPDVAPRDDPDSGADVTRPYRFPKFPRSPG